MKKRVLITVHGKVQNVGFRYFTHKTALELGVHGFVKNQQDGTVYIEAEASDSVLEQFIEKVKVGPKWSEVSHVNIQHVNANDRSGFVIR